MAVTYSTDLAFVPEDFKSYVIENSTTKTALWTSGAVVNVDALMPEGGTTMTMPNFVEPEHRAEKIVEGQALPVHAITSKKQVAVIHESGTGFGRSDVAAWRAAADPLAAIQTNLSRYWARELNAVAASTLLGSTKLVHGDGTADLDYEAVMNALELAGENADGFNLMITNSKTRTKLSIADKTDFLAASSTDILDRFVGKSLLVNNVIPAGYTLLLKQGALGYVDGTPADVLVEFDRDKAKGENVIFTRRRFVMHPAGMMFDANLENPSDAQLLDAANWTAATAVKNLSAILIKHRA